jgi:transposase-like protein
MKPGSCSVCEDARRAEIDQAHVSGASIRELAKRFGRAPNTIWKHVGQHIPDATRRAIEAAEARDTAHGASVLDELADLCTIGRRLLDKAEAKRDYRTAISGLRELVRLAEVKARITGEMVDPAVNVHVDGETAIRMAQMFLQRRQAKAITAPEIEVSAGVQPPLTLQVTENEPSK